MFKFMIATFLVLFWGFYEMSDGADFVPEERQVAKATIVPARAPAQVVKPVNLATVRPAPTNVSSDGYVPFHSPQPVTATFAVADATSGFNSSSTDEAVIESAAFSAPEQAAPVEPSYSDLRLVAGDRVNMRSGPGTSFDVLNTLPRGTEAEVIEVNNDGWAQIRLLDTNEIGWMAERLLIQG